VREWPQVPPSSADVPVSWEPHPAAVVWLVSPFFGSPARAGFPARFTALLKELADMERADTHDPDRNKTTEPERESGEEKPQPTEKTSEDKGEKKPPEDPKVARRKKRRAIIIGCIVGAVVLICAGIYGGYYYHTGRYLIATDDAYTQSDNTIVAAQVSGYVETLLVTDNQPVHRGQAMARIDSRLYQAAVDQAQSDFVSASVNVANATAQIELQQAVIVQADAQIKSDQAALAFAQEESDRYAKLAKTLAGTVQDKQRTAAQLQQAQANLEKSKATAETERRRLTVLASDLHQAEAAVGKAQATQEQAKVNLSYTEIVAPIDGVVGDRKVQTGQYVQPGTRLLTLVPTQAIYVIANYKETQLDRMHTGQAVEMTVDAYPGVTVHGHVDSLAPGSGSQFALLPPENATGNFTKIVQRVPIKILIDPNDPLHDRLRPGLSVLPTIDTRDTRGQSLRERPAPDAVPPSTTTAPQSSQQ
jgi:membrane fusion protein (multidrug efflux system)